MFCSNNGIRRSPSNNANIINLASLLLLAIIFFSGHMVFCDDTTPIPTDAGGVNGWFSTNMKPAADRKGGLDPTLAAAEESPQVIKVRKDGSAGEYVEKIKIEAVKPFITFYGSPDAMPTISYSGTAYQYGTVDSASLIVDSDYFMAANIIIKNSAPRPDGVRKGAQAMALRISGTKAAFYKVRMIGFQDTLCDDKGYHFYKDCYIEGTVDFIFGRAKSLDTATEDCGYSFVHGQITRVGTGAYLGRAWMPSPRVIFAYTTMSSVVNPAGWDINFKPEREKTVYFAKYKCSGPGANPSGRVKYTMQLSEAEVQPFISLGYIQGSKWVLPPPTL
ncbi:hypothetical protein EZV62_005445 [Acer yangbiense]|uniref:Pectinesterase n=1 Tax=Acer yangbiense TaxID=1000413 RepID=A0A5C7IMS4_9ROSI|nr:hypothetical protein EZV62_005445 [Acer yangbiense]